MTMLTEEALAGIRLLVCMAKADGVLTPDERYALEDALAGFDLPDDITIDTLLKEKQDPLQLAQCIKTPEGRDYAYASVFALAYCDRNLSSQEERILVALREAWGINPEEDVALKSALDAGHSKEHHSTSYHAPIKTAEERQAAFERLLLRYSILTGITGAIPIPVVPDLLVIPIQVKMVYDVAHLFGQKTNKETVQLMFETFGVGTGARIGITALCKMVPGWGSVVGAASSFATTYALAKVAYTYFKSEGRESMESLKPMFQQERVSGRLTYQKHEAALQEAHKSHAETLKQLAYDLQHGRITQKAYEQQIDKLGEEK